ncbi:uncharacterized protein N7482_000329 [Penicillium canariense]|uniref:Uncharacterized protein n=1 Tax=Penicillium canariense TaxID=189055 RepID=A0A9W9LT16_9EURO|nr:uncharacterized protein N7482_000329 [Penicillium canariense]KAJ5174452.1 hypothetical protein N7482_000329 [Penicillium canariense]
MLLTLKPPTGDSESNEYTLVDQRRAPSRASQWSQSSSWSGSTSMESSPRSLPSPTPLYHSMTGHRLAPKMPAALPPAPGSWESAETMYHWLQAKIEEDRRCQEEEKTRQETLKLERRKADHAILVDALRAGVPPHLIPLVVLNGGGSAKATLDILQQHVTDLTRDPPVPPPQQPVHSRPSPPPLPPLSHQFCQPATEESPRDMRTVPSHAYASPAHNQSTRGGNSSSQLPAGGRGGSHTPFISTVSTSNKGAVFHLPRPMESTARSQSATGVHAVHYIGAPPPPQHPSPRGPREPQPGRPSPSISFHHWVPPGQSQTQVRSNTTQEERVLPSNAPFHIRSEMQDSPGRKRKSQSIHRQLPPPSSRLSDAPERSSRYRRQSPTDSHAGQAGLHGDHRQQSHVSSSHEILATARGYTNQVRDAVQPRPVEPSVATEQGLEKDEGRSPGGDIKREEDNRGPDRENDSRSSSRGQASHAEKTSAPPQGTGRNTRSGGMAGRGDRE